MSRYEKEIRVYRDGKENPVAMRIRPGEFTDPELIRFVSKRVFVPGDRQCISRMATKTLIFSEEYIRDVAGLNPSRRQRHIADTVYEMSKAVSVFIQEKGSR